MNQIAPYWKAIMAFIAPGFVVLLSSIQEGSDGGSAITQSEWITAIAAMVLTSAGVWAVPNKDPDGSHQHMSVQSPTKV